jgi:hypothetical protein
VVRCEQKAEKVRVVEEEVDPLDTALLGDG